jgi:hypothetical protein
MEFGDGVYFNECSEDLPDWKVQFWGNMDNYQRLLAAKQKWDPDGFFWCHNCVGSDLVANDTGAGGGGGGGGVICPTATCGAVGVKAMSAMVVMMVMMMVTKLLL